jgi:AraC-like DNA-binding protein
MTTMPALLRAEFSVSDLMREAAERSLGLEFTHEPVGAVTTPVFSGTLLAEEVQPGLIATAHDLTYLQENVFDVQMGKSLICGVLLAGESGPLEVPGHPPIFQPPEQPVIVAFGETMLCRRALHAGQRNRVSGFMLKPDFFERFGELVEDDGLAILSGFVQAGFRTAELPRSTALLAAARKTFGHPYGGQLRSLFLESNALSLVIEVARLLKEKQHLTALIGKRHYDRVMQARDILDASLAAPPKTVDLARQVGINVTSLRANFRTVFGTTIFGYIRDQRLEMARLLLLEYGLKVAEAGYKVGFSNPAAFAAAYRRHFGHPPSHEAADRQR